MKKIFILILVLVGLMVMINVVSGLTGCDCNQPLGTTCQLFCFCEANPGAPACPVCGNGICEAAEDSSTCPADCGSAAVCGNGICEAAEDSTNCPTDCPLCNHNGVCEPDKGETTTNCNKINGGDCGPCDYCSTLDPNTAEYEICIRGCCACTDVEPWGSNSICNDYCLCQKCEECYGPTMTGAAIAPTTGQVVSSCPATTKCEKECIHSCCVYDTYGINVGPFFQGGWDIEVLNKTKRDAQTEGKQINIPASKSFKDPSECTKEGKFISTSYCPKIKPEIEYFFNINKDRDGDGWPDAEWINYPTKKDPQYEARHWYWLEEEWLKYGIDNTDFYNKYVKKGGLGASSCLVFRGPSGCQFRKAQTSTSSSSSAQFTNLINNGLTAQGIYEWVIV